MVYLPMMLITVKIKEETNKILETLPFAYSMHDFRIVSGPTHTNIVFDIVVPFDCKMKDGELKEYIEKYI